MFSVGQKIGSYVIARCLGQGGQGAVYKAFDPMLRRYVAIKLLSSDREQHDDIVREARIIANLDHPNIIKIHHVDRLRQPSVWYLVMEYLDGGTLSDLLAQHGGALACEEAVQFALQVASALEATHQKGIVHRDIKPSNMLLSGKHALKLSDFGLATYSSHQVVFGKNLGTPHYMAPEIWLGEEAGTPESDIYALGACLYQMLVGVPPFDAADVDQLAWMHIHEKPPPLQIVLPSFPPALGAVVLQCLEKTPSSRIRSAKALQDALTVALRKQHNLLLEGSKDPSYASLERIALIREHAQNNSEKASSYPYLRWFGLALPPQRAPQEDERIQPPHSSPSPLESTARLRAYLEQVWFQAGGSPLPWLSTDAVLLLKHISNGDLQRLHRLLHNALFLACCAQQRILTSWSVIGASAYPEHIAHKEQIKPEHCGIPPRWPDAATLEILQKLKNDAHALES